MTAGSFNETPRGSRFHIAIFGRRNAGKSSLINALTNQEIAIVSSLPGTTTDPVYKTMEILPLGPVVLIDTAGIDDVGELGNLRIKKTIGVLAKADLMVLVIDAGQTPGEKAYELELIRKAGEQGVPVLGVLNKIDLYPEAKAPEFERLLGIRVVPASAASRQGIEQLVKEMIRLAPKDWSSPTILGDLINPGDTVVLVVPIDLAAITQPKEQMPIP